MQTTYRALSDGTLVAHVPIKFARTAAGGRIFAQENGKNKERNLEMPVVQAVATALRWRAIAATDRYPSRFKMAESIGVDSSYLARTLHLAYLSPKIVEKLVAGELPLASVKSLTEIQTPVWSEQHKALGID